jgi:hypothetical protein
MYQVGFRFAPKLHGILTKAQAVLQLFSFMPKGLCTIRLVKIISIFMGWLVEMQYYYLG